MARIELNDITFRYEGHNGPRTALSHVSLAVEDGEFVCLVGRSGCGKTTLLRLIAGLQFPASGQILLDGKPVTGPGTDRAVVFQNYALFPNMTVLDNVKYALNLKLKNKNKAKEEALKMLKVVNMEEHLNKYPHELSDGQQQRVAIART